MGNIKVYQALAGCGKSTTAYIDMIKQQYNNKNVLSISFTKTLKRNQMNMGKTNKKIIEQNAWNITGNISILDRNNTFTLHQFCYKILKRANRIKRIFKNEKDFNEMEFIDFNKNIGDVDNIENYEKKTNKKTNEKKKKLKLVDYEKLISEVNKMKDDFLENYLFDIFNYVDVLTIDEFQDFNIQHLELIKKIFRVANINGELDIVMTVDFLQNIYEFDEKTNNNFSSVTDIQEFFEVEDSNFEVKNLFINYRSNNEIQAFVNAFLRKNKFLSISEENLYKADMNNLREDYKPVCRIFDNLKVEIKYVILKAREYQKKGKSVMIIAQNNRVIRSYKFIERKSKSKLLFHQHNTEMIDEVERINKISKEKDKEGEESQINKKIRVLSIHKAKGLEADVVFYVGFDSGLQYESYGYYPSDKKLDSKIMYVAFTRARERLYITSSINKDEFNNQLEELFDTNLIVKKGTQKKLCKLYKVPQKVVEESEFLEKEITVSFLKKNPMDSLVISILPDDISHFIHKSINIKRLKDGKNDSSYIYLYKFDNQWDFKHVVKYHLSSRRYFFDFKSLFFFKKRRIDDTTVQKYLANIVIKFFDYRIKIEDLLIKRIDYAFYKECRSKIEIDKTEINILKALIKVKNPYKFNDIEGYAYSNKPKKYNKEFTSKEMIEKLKDLKINKKEQNKNKKASIHNRDLPHIEKETFYCNLKKNLRAATYLPNNKEENKRIPKEKLIKTEVRFMDYSDTKKLYSGKNQMIQLFESNGNIDIVKEYLIKNEGLKDLFDIF